MNIGGINQSKPIEIEKVYKAPQNIKISKPIQINNSQAEKENNDIEIKAAVGKINKLLEGQGSHLQYEKHDVLNQMIIRVIDNNTNEVIKEIPSKKILDMVAKMCEMAGILMYKKA